jgi:hypothetical protein
MVFMDLFLMTTLYLFVLSAEWGSNAVLFWVQVLIRRLTSAKKRPVENPHMRMPVKASTGASIRHGGGNMRSH